MTELVLGKYQAIRRIAVGGMGEIFLGRQRAGGFDRLVILKALLPELGQQSGFVDQFLDEARVAAALNHPNIVSVYEAGIWNAIHLIVMEYIHGESLAGLLSASGKARASIPFGVTARIIHDAAMGLDHAHHATDSDGRQLNTIHRDVTPSNLMVRTDGVTKILDFGVARAANRATRTATGQLKGKLSYMPPEQLRGDSLDARTDQWGLGVVLWECLTGTRLFRRDGQNDMIRLIMERDVPAPSTCASDVPPQLEAVVTRMLRRDREERFADLGDVAAAIRSYLDATSDQSSESCVAAFVTRTAGERIDDRTRDLTPATSTLPIYLRHGSARRRHSPRFLAGLAALAFLAGLTFAGTLVLLLSPRSAPPPVPAQATQLTTPHPPADAPESSTDLVVICDPVGASVSSGGRLLGQAPLRVRSLLPDTDYELVLDKPRFLPSTVKVRLDRGKAKQISVTLEKSPR